MIVVDYRISEKSIAALCERGMSVIRSVPVPALYEAVKGHPDMQIHPLGDGRVICAPETYAYYKDRLDAELICGNVSLKEEYPCDIAYNAAVAGEYLICNAKHTAPELLEAYAAMGKKLISVRQGYAKCSVAVVSEAAVITADVGIYKTVSGVLDALLISQGHIRLDTMPYGFIGGATGLIEQNVLAVNGDIAFHPDGERIKAFCKEHGTELLCLNDDILCDVGTILRV